MINRQQSTIICINVCSPNIILCFDFAENGKKGLEVFRPYIAPVQSIYTIGNIRGNSSENNKSLKSKMNKEHWKKEE